MRSERRASRTGQGLRERKLAVAAIILGSIVGLELHAERRNFALNSDQSELPRVLETDCGWGGGDQACEILDGNTAYSVFNRGLACNRGVSGVIALELAAEVTFDEVVLWHHGRAGRIPLNVNLDYWDGAAWVPIEILDRQVEVTSFPQRGFGSLPDHLYFEPVTSSRVRFSYPCCEGLEGARLDHAWLYEFQVFGNAELDPEPNEKRTNVASNTELLEYPRVLETNCGWGGGNQPFEILDGRQAYCMYQRGMACPQNSFSYIALEFGDEATFDEVVLWHHGRAGRIPLNVNLDYWDGAAWVPIEILDRDVVVGDTFPQRGFGSFPDHLYFDPVTSSRIRFSHDAGAGLDGEVLDHSWLYQFDVLAVAEDVLLKRGDCNGDGNVDISDAVCILNWLFLGGTTPGCVAVTNTNGDGGKDISDATYLLNHLFLGGPAPVAPFPECGPGTLPTDEGACEIAPKNCPQ